MGVVRDLTHQEGAAASFSHMFALNLRAVQCMGDSCMHCCVGSLGEAAVLVAEVL